MAGRVVQIAVQVRARDLERVIRARELMAAARAYDRGTARFMRLRGHMRERTIERPELPRTLPGDWPC